MINIKAKTTSLLNSEFDDRNTNCNRGLIKQNTFNEMPIRKGAVIGRRAVS